MKSSTLISGVIIFALGMVLSLPSLVMDASGTNIKTSGQAISFITGNLIKDISNTDQSPENMLNKIPPLLVIIGMILIVIYLFFRFFII